jgi:gluconate 2-dehydrogenase
MKPKILIARAIFPETVDKLRMHFDVEDNQADELWSKPQFAAKLADKVGALTTSQPVDAETLASASQLKICANMAVGFNNFDVAAMTARGVLGTNTPDVLTETTADFGFALVMAIARRMTESEHFLRAGKWDRWRYDMFVGSEVHGSTLGILGMGRIGQGIARRGAHGFGMNVIYNNRSRLAPELEAQCKARYVSKEELLRTADHLVLVLPYTPESHHTIGEKEIAMMKPTATLTNVARGGIVDDAALARALRERRIDGAALDVFEGEPQVHPDLLGLSNVVLTPHIASATVTTRRKMSELAADNLIGYLVHGKPLTPVNPEVLKA